jgi:hypothetical protein
VQSLKNYRTRCSRSTYDVIYDLVVLPTTETGATNLLPSPCCHRAKSSTSRRSSRSSRFVGKLACSLLILHH